MPAWSDDDMEQLRRFVYLGTENMYSPSRLGPDQKYADLINRLIKEGKGTEVVKVIANISHCGWAPRQNYIIFALAVCARSDDIGTKKMAYDVMCKICRNTNELFMFVYYCQPESGKSQSPSTDLERALVTAVLKWYKEKCKNPEETARLLTKYKSRKSVGNEKKWLELSHKDIFKSAHPSSDDIMMNVVREFVLNGLEKASLLASKEAENDERVKRFLTYIEGTIKAKKCTNEGEMVHLIKKYGLKRIHVPTALENSHSVWEAIIKNMTPEDKIRNIGMISAKGFCGEDSEIEKKMIEEITNAVALHRARVHPMRVLSALLTCKNKGKSTGPEPKPQKPKDKVNTNIVKALNNAFELFFKDIPSTGKRLLLAVDVSENMRGPCKGYPQIMCYQAAAAMMMMTARTEPKCKIIAFSKKSKPIHVDKKDTIFDIVEEMEKVYKLGEKKSLQSEKADSAQPILWAVENKKPIDVFIVYTANIPTDGQTHPSTALDEYRRKRNQPDTKLVVVEMASNLTTADQAITSDYREINIVGFDAHAATLIAKFIKDEI